MTKTKKLIALFVVVAMLFTFVATIAACTTPHECDDKCPTCDKCLTECTEEACADKCQGHGTPNPGPAPTHTCKHVCPTCQKCTDATCTDAACAQKCQGHGSVTPSEHECKHVCPTCQKCLDENCKDAACTDKCPGHGGQEEPENKYGTESAPLSVSQALDLADEECANAGEVTAEVVYAIGKVKSIGPTKSSAYLSEVYITDLSDPSREILIYSLNVNAGVATPVQNDIISIHGYIKNYDGKIEFASNKVDGSDVYVYTYNNVRGTSTITLVNEGGATVTGLPQTATNGEVVTFTVEAPADKQISEVKLGDSILQKGDDGYTFTVTGDATITITTADAGQHVAELVYTLTTNVSGSNNSYTGNCDVTVNGKVWNVEGNSTMDPWRLGGKSVTNTDRSLTSKTAIDENVCKIIIKFGSWSSSGITVNSVKLTVFKTDAGDPVEIIDVTGAASGGTVTIEKTSGNDWSNCCYKLTFNVTIPGSSNVYVTVSSMEFYA